MTRWVLVSTACLLVLQNLGLSSNISNGEMKSQIEKSNVADPELTTAEAIDIIQTSAWIDDMAVGFAVVTTERYRAFARLYRAGKAVERQLRSLIQDKATTPAGKIYAAIVLRRVDKDRTAELLEELSASQEKVRILSGCMMQEYMMSDVVKRLLLGSTIIQVPK